MGHPVIYQTAVKSVITAGVAVQLNVQNVWLPKFGMTQIARLQQSMATVCNGENLAAPVKR